MSEYSLITFSIMVVKFISDQLIKPGKSPVFDDPKEYGLDYEDVTFTTSDGVALTGWLIKGGNNKVIIQTHFGLQASRSGYTIKEKNFISRLLWNKDIHFLKQAKYLSEAGYSVLMYDMRNHGNSGEGTSPWAQYGLDERKDVLAAVDFISRHPDYQNASIGLLSICMGAAATTFAYGMEPTMKENKNVKAMIALQPLIYDEFVRVLGLPNFLIKKINRFNKEQRNTDLTGDSFMPYAKDIAVPTLLIQNNNDPMTNKEMIQRYYDDLPAEKDLLWLDIEKKRGAGYEWLGNNPESILHWFGKYL